MKRSLRRITRSPQFRRFAQRHVGTVGQIIQGYGSGAIGFGLTVSFAYSFTPQRAPLWVVPVSSFLIVLGCYMHMLGRRIAVNRLNKLLVSSPHPEILYLRPFPTAGIKSNIYNPIVGLVRSIHSSPEERVLNQLWALGIVATIGRPGDYLPTMGAIHIHLSPSEWRDDVADYILGAKWVVARLSNRDNLMWEIDVAARKKHRSNLLFWFPPIDTWGEELEHCDWKEIQPTLERGLGINLPKSIGQGEFLYFDVDSKPVVSTNLREFVERYGALKHPIYPMTMYRRVEVFFTFVGLLIGSEGGIRWLLAISG